jgi:hypothetical protein
MRENKGVGDLIMTSRTRKVALTAHITSTLGWLGAIAAPWHRVELHPQSCYPQNCPLFSILLWQWFSGGGQPYQREVSRDCTPTATQTRLD